MIVEHAGPYQKKVCAKKVANYRVMAPERSFSALLLPQIENYHKFHCILAKDLKLVCIYMLKRLIF